MLKLFFAPGTIATATAIALEEADLSYEPIKINFSAAEQTSPDYLKINPKGRVPTLITESGTILTETGALLEYVAARAPTAGLVPDDPEQAAHMRSVMYYMAATMHVAHAHKLRGSRWADQQSSFDDMKAKVPQTVAACAAYVEAECLRGDYILGAQFSLADAHLFTIAGWMAGDGVPPAHYPKIDAFMNRMEQRDSVKALRAKGIL